MATTEEKHLQETTVEMDNQVQLLTEQVNRMQSMLEQYVTRDELKTTLLDSITSQLTTRLNEIDTAGENRHAEFVRHYEQRLETLVTRTEFEGVTTASAENAQRLTVLEATAETRLSRLEKRADQSEEIQKKQTESIQSMSQNTASIKESVEAMQRTYLQAMELDKKRQQDVDRDLTSLKDADAQNVKDISTIRGHVSSLDSGVNTLRGDVAAVHPMRDSLSDLKTRISSQEAWRGTVDQTFVYVGWVASNVRWLFKERSGNVVLAIIIAIIAGFQIYYGVMSYQLTQRYTQLISIIAALQTALQ